MPPSANDKKTELINVRSFLDIEWKNSNENKPRRVPKKK
jgi:hypothetical protein